MFQKESQSSNEFSHNLVEVAAEYNPFVMPGSSGAGTLLSEFISPTQDHGSTAVRDGDDVIKTKSVPTVFIDTATASSPATGQSSKLESPSESAAAQQQTVDLFSPHSDNQLQQKFSLKDLQIDLDFRKNVPSNSKKTSFNA